MQYTSINLGDKLARFSERWSPRVIAQMNDSSYVLDGYRFAQPILLFN